MRQSFVLDSRDPLLKLCRIGGWFAFAQAFSVVLAIVGYFLWPYVFFDHSIQMIFEGINRDPFVYFMKLDPVVLFGTLLQFPVWFGIWAALRQVDAAKSLIALVLGMISTIAILTARPIIEMYSLSSLFVSANTDTQRQAYIAAGETLLSQFHGTPWAISIISGGLSAVIFAFIMRKCDLFQKATFWAMLLSGLGALVAPVPVVGTISLFFLGTIVGFIGTILCGFDLLQIKDQ